MVPRTPDAPGSTLEAIGRLGALVPVAREEAAQAHARCEELERRVLALEIAAESGRRDGDRWRRWLVWLVDRFVVPLVCAAAGALAARKGWLP